MTKKSLSWVTLCIVIFFLFLPNLLTAFIITDATAITPQHYHVLLAIAAEVILFACVGRGDIFLLLQLPFFIWLPIELVYIIRYGSPTSAHILNIISETNLDEVLGYVGGYDILILYIFYILAVAVSLIFLWGKNIAWRHRSRWWAFISIAGLFLINGVFDDKLNREMAKSRAVFSEVDEFVAPQFVLGLDEYKNTYPMGLVLRVVEFYQQQKILKETAASLANIESKLIREKSIRQEVYVVVIGESSRADHWMLNGYARATTPLLSTRTDIVNYSNAVSVAATTRTAVPVLLSRSSVSDIIQSNLKSSWVSEFKQKGFKTYWLSTQMPVGTHDTLIGAYADLANKVQYFNLGRYSIHSDFDEVLLPALKSALDSNEEKKLIVLHTLGSHAPYHFRYPSSFSVFSPVPDDHLIVDIFDHKINDQVINAYDNSVRYTDFVVNEAIELIKKKNLYSALWYISDHGETFSSENCASVGHGFGSKNNFHVPLIFWASTSFAEANPSIINGAKSQKDKPVYSADFFDTLMMTAGFENRSRAFNAFVKESYTVPKRMVATSGAAAIDYDLEYANNACGKK
ncbi:MAG: phosphoethanolamine transferase [Gammaproteobacteria bacterium]|nr:MAG: phosphoethanolamine transferase [Gammaproteobacteria bacterium]